jgi:glycosyltransferase involved in cell wall biosynthesis
MGGIATLMARMAEWLIARGHTVQVLVANRGELGEMFPPQVIITEVREGFHKLCKPLAARAAINSLGLRSFDVIKAFDTKSAWIASLLAVNMRPRPKLLCGNYGLGFFPPRHKPFRAMWPRLHARNVVRSYTPNNLLFMGEEHRAILKRNYGERYDGIVWPLPVDASRFKEAKRSPKRGQIVSIGRLSPMKEYNLYMIDIVERLAGRDASVHWHVYGEGLFENQMRESIAARGLTKHITLHGRLNYQRFQEALREAWVFVGMGTAAVEAGLCGVPTLVALAYDRVGKTYGALQDWSFGNVGDVGQTKPEKMVGSEIAAILALSDQDYAEESRLVQEYALRYDRDKLMEKYMDIIAGAAPAADLSALHWLSYVHGAFSGVRSLLSRS